MKRRFTGAVLALALAGCHSSNGLYQDSFDLAGFFSLPDLAAAASDLGGVGGPGLGQLGAPCARATDCNSGICLPIGRCSQPCGVSALCPQSPEWACAPLAGGGVSVCQCTPSSLTEACDLRDNDCDGIIDNGALCPGGSTCSGGRCVASECTTVLGTLRQKFVAYPITLPLQRTSFAYDLNGDGQLDNQYGSIVGALASQMLGLQTQESVSQAAGRGLLLLELVSSDPLFQNDLCAGANARHGQDHPSPDYSGAGSFSVDATFSTGAFAGSLAAGSFSSNSPATATVPVSLQVQVPFIAALGGDGAPLTTIPLTGAHLQFRVAGGKLTKGQLNGVVTNQNMQQVVIPQSAMQLTQQIAANPGSARSQTVLQIFDNGGAADPSCPKGCRNSPAANDCAVAGDQIISACEISTNSIIKNVLNPDLDMFAPDGSYHPNPANTSKDSLSFGIGFEAPTATF